MEGERKKSSKHEQENYVVASIQKRLNELYFSFLSLSNFIQIH